jgi:hypothetical protein
MHFTGIFVALLILLAPVARAGNEHEHLQYLPRYSDIVGATPDESLDHFASSTVLPDNFKEVIVPRFGPSYLTRAEFLSKRKELTFRDFAEWLSTRIPHSDPDSIMQGFFELMPAHLDRVNSYRNAGTIRNYFFKHHPELITRAVTHFLHSTHDFLNMKTVFAVPFEMAKPSILVPIAREFAKKNLQAQFYESFTRATLAGAPSEFAKRLADSEAAVNAGWLHGIDLVGSLSDATAQGGEKEVLKSNLLALFASSQKHGYGIRIHAFESTSTGVFYDALREALWGCVLKRVFPRVLRIGHIRHLDTGFLGQMENLKFFARTTDEPFEAIFELNLESNLQLVGGSVPETVARVQDLHKRGFKVVMGSDGAGILGTPSRFDVTILKLQEADLGAYSVEKLIDDAYAPLASPQLQPWVYESWIKKRDLLKKVVAEERIRSLQRIPGCNELLLRKIIGH